MMKSENKDLHGKVLALENEMAGLRLDGERRERQVQEERQALAHKMAQAQQEVRDEIVIKIDNDNSTFHLK